MRVVFVTTFILGLFSIGSAQKASLPNVLRPNELAVNEAKQLGVNVFKILPWGIFMADAANAYTDEGNPIGIRGGGAFYSFATGSHSYNKIPQLKNESDRLSVGFYGLSYGFITDLGAVGLQAVGKENPELEQILTYKPAKFEKDIRKEQYASQHSAPAIVGHTYALRAISYNEADTVVVFNVYNKDEDGAFTIFWKKIADFPKPIALDQTDEELRDKVQSILNENGFSYVRLSVKDNWIEVSGTVPKGTFYDLWELLRNVRRRGFTNSLKEQ